MFAQDVFGHPHCGIEDNFEIGPAKDNHHVEAQNELRELLCNLFNSL